MISTHSVGGFRSSNLVSKNLRTSSLWEMWEGSFIRACGGEGRERATDYHSYTYLKCCMPFLRKMLCPLIGMAARNQLVTFWVTVQSDEKTRQRVVGVVRKEGSEPRVRGKTKENTKKWWSITKACCIYIKIHTSMYWTCIKKKEIIPFEEWVWRNSFLLPFGCSPSLQISFSS